MVTPNTIVKLYSGVPCDPTYQNVLQWDSVEEQNQFFANMVPVATYTDVQFYQPTRQLRVKRQMENCYNINYVAYQNHRYGNKWFYAFVDSMEYLSAESTGLNLSEDIWATWQFDLTFNKSFVERETVSDDTIGTNTVPEDLEIGPYVATKEANKIYSNYYIVIVATELIIKPNEPSGFVSTPSLIMGIPQPCYVINMGTTANANYDGITKFISNYSLAGKSNAIIAMFLYPTTDGEVITHFKDKPAPLEETFTCAARTLSFNPRNNKLYTHPYCALSINSMNECKALRYELFNGTPTLKTTKTFGVNPTIVATPINYEGMAFNVKHQLSCSGFPVLPWIQDYYQNWIAQNKATQGVSVVSGLINGIGAGAAVGAAAHGLAQTAWGAAMGVTAVGAGAVALPVLAVTGLSIAKVLAQRTQEQIVPDTLNGSANAVDANAATKRVGFYTQCMSIRPEYGRIIDDYFSLYGYAVHRVKELEMHSRENWNYIKTVGCNVIGKCPKDVIDGIKTIFDNGVTLWHNGNFNYGTLANPIIS